MKNTCVLIMLAMMQFALFPVTAISKKKRYVVKVNTNFNLSNGLRLY